MADAINGIPGIKPNDLTINWNDCTATEVIEYKEEGQEVPTAVLAWAQEMAKNQGAADEITYEMSQNNPDQMAVDTVDNTNIGANLRAEMDENGVSLMDQAKRFGNESNNYSGTIDTLETEMQNILAQSEEASANIEEYSTNLLSQIQTLKAKQESSINDKSSPFGAFGAIQIENQIRELANFGLSTIERDSQSVYSATNGIIAALDTADSTVSIGTESKNIGEEVQNLGMLAASALASFAISSGSNAINNAQAGKNTFNNTDTENRNNEERVNNASQDIKNAGGTSGTTNTEEDTETNEQDNEENVENAANEAVNDNEPVAENVRTASEKFEQDRRNQEENAQIDPTLADTNITTDPNEILKRKERRGLV